MLCGLFLSFWGAECHQGVLKSGFTKGVFYITLLGQSCESENTDGEGQGYRIDTSDDFTKPERGYGFLTK